MKTVKFKNGEVKQVTSRHPEILVLKGEAEIFVKEEKEVVKTKEEKKTKRTK